MGADGIDRLVILNDLSQPKGGATAVALEAAHAMRALGLPVTLIAGDEGQNAALTQAGIEIVALGGQRLRANPARALLSGLYHRAARSMVADWIAAHDTPRTLYHLHGWAQILSPSLFHALAPVRGRLVLSAHDFFLACPNGSFSFLKSGAPCPHTPLSPACALASCDRRNHAEKLWRLARHAVLRHAYRPGTSPPVLAVHKAMAPLLARGGIPAEAISALPNPVRAWSHERIPAETNRDLLFVGRLEETKGPDLALEGARRAGARLRDNGDGALRTALQKAYPEMIFTGALPRDEIARHARQARLLLMPSRYPEPYGLVAVEALWSGLPVILPSTASLAPQIVAAKAGLAVPPQDINSMASTIRQLMRDDGQIADLSRHAHAGTAALGLSPQVWAQQLLAIYLQRLKAVDPD